MGKREDSSFGGERGVYQGVSFTGRARVPRWDRLVLEKLPDKDEVVKMCNQVLEIDPRKIGKRKNGDHFCPPKFKERIEGIVQYLIVEKKISRSDVSLFSCSLILADAMLTAALRKQDTLGQLARDLHRLKCQDVHGDAVAITRCLLPRLFKDKKALENSTCGVVVNHTKNEKCEGAHVFWRL